MPFDATSRMAAAIPFAFDDYLELVDSTGRSRGDGGGVGACGAFARRLAYRGSIVQCGEGVGIGFDDLQKRACGPGGANAVLFPVLQRLGFDADQVGEAGLA